MACCIGQPIDWFQVMARMIVFVADLRDTVARTNPPAMIRWGTTADRDVLLAGGTSEAGVDWALANGARFAVAEQDDRIIAHNIYLTSREVRQQDWLVIRLRQGRDVFSLGGFVRPEYRGRKLLAGIKGYAARYFLEQGYCRNISLVDADNAASIKAHAHVGAVPLTELRRHRLGDLVLVTQGFAPRHIGLRRRKPYVFSP